LNNSTQATKKVIPIVWSLDITHIRYTYMFGMLLSTVHVTGSPHCNIIFYFSLGNHKE